MYLLYYIMNDMQCLRILTVTAACCLIAYLYLCPEPTMTVISWNLFFAALNIFQICCLMKKRQQEKMKEIEVGEDPGILVTG